jgi:MFS family permease
MPMRQWPLWVIMVVIMLAELIATLEASMIYTALPTISREYGGLGNVGWLLTSFLLVQAGAAAIGGRLGDLYGRRLVLLITLALCSVGSLISAVAEDLTWIIIGRTVQGVSGAILPLSFGLVRENAQPRDVPFWIGVVTGAYAGSGAIGFVLGGALTEFAGWRSIFWVTALLPPFVMLATLIVVPLSKAILKSGKIDLIGGLLFLPPIAGLLLVVSNGASWGWASPTTLGILFGSAAVLAAWVWHELRHPDPLIDVRLLGNKQIVIANIGFALLGIGALQMPLVLLMLAQQPVWTGVGLGVGATVAGLLKLPSNLTSAVAAPWSGAIARKHGARRAVIIGAMISTIGWATLAVYHETLWFLVMMFVVVGGAIAFVMSATPNLIIEVSPPGRTSEATGLSYVFRAVALAAGAQICATLLASSTVTGPDGATFPSEAAYVLTFSFIAATAALQVVLMFLLPQRRPREEEVKVAAQEAAH